MKLTPVADEMYVYHKDDDLLNSIVFRLSFKSALKEQYMPKTVNKHSDLIFDKSFEIIKVTDCISIEKFEIVYTKLASTVMRITIDHLTGDIT